jgi:hypothetical protein
MFALQRKIFNQSQIGAFIVNIKATSSLMAATQTSQTQTVALLTLQRRAYSLSALVFLVVKKARSQVHRSCLAVHLKHGHTLNLFSSTSLRK